MVKALRSGKKNTLAWVLVGLLILGLAGFGIGGFVGTSSSIGSVGAKEIPARDYLISLRNQANYLQAQIGRQPSFAELQNFGFVQAALSGLITQAAFVNEANEAGLSVGDETVLDELRKTTAFHGTSGEFDKEVYEFSLERTGLTASEYDEVIRDNKSREIITSAISGGLQVSSTLKEVLADYALERRSFNWALIDKDEFLGDSTDVSEAELMAFHEENPNEFTVPETRNITYAWLLPRMLADEVEVSDSALRSLYEERTSVYNQPERRIADRLIFPDIATANAAMARLDAGEVSFDALVTERGLTSELVDIGDVARDEIETDAGNALFALEEPGVTPVVTTSLGPAIFRMNAVLSAMNQSFAEVRSELRDELALEGAARMISENIETFEDLLAGGATLEALAAETDFELGSIAFNALSDEEIASYPEFSGTATQISEDDYPELMNIADDGLVAMRLDSVVAPTVSPFEEVRTEVREAVLERRAIDESIARAEEAAEGLRGDADFADFGLSPRFEEARQRVSYIEGFPFDFVQDVFGLDADATGVFEVPSGAAVVQLVDVIPYDPSSEDAIAYFSRVDQSFGPELANEVVELFVNQLQQSAGLSLDQNAINYVNSQLN